MAQNLTISYLEQAISVLENFLNSSKIDKEEEISKIMDTILNTFSLSESKIKSIENALSKSDLKIDTKPDIEMEEPDLLFLKASVLKARIKYDKDKVNFDTNEIDFGYLLKTLQDRLKRELKKIERAKRQEALKRIQEKGLEINAVNLSKEADMTVEEAETYLYQLNRVGKARSNNPKVK